MTTDASTSIAPLSGGALDFLATVIGDLRTTLEQDARDERELLEGQRVLWRAVSLCSELMLDVDPDVPRFFPMTTAARQIGGPNPDGTYDLCTVMPGRSYRVTGVRGSSAYLGFQVMAGVGLAPRRSAAYLSDYDLRTDSAGRFSFILSADDPGSAEQWVQIPEDASAIVVRQYVGDAGVEVLATYDIESLSQAAAPEVVTDEVLAEQLSALGWTVVKLLTLHRTVLPELIDDPNVLRTAESAALGSENTTPDNLYMLGVFDLAEGEALQVDLVPPDSRYWSVTLENIWHECLEPSRRASSITNKRVVRRADGTVRLVIAPTDPGVPNWLDTGGRRRGFVVVRWLDKPTAPDVTTTVINLNEATA